MNSASLPQDQPQLSVVIPFLNEAEVLPATIQRLQTILATLPESSEIVFVDDGSTDTSAEVIAACGRTAADIRLIQLSRNFGKEAAMTAGLAHARGQAIVILDADLQDPPELIPEMLTHWRSGIDVVQMRRKFRHGETAGKRLSAFLFYRLLNQISNHEIPLDTGDFRLMSRKALNALLQLTEKNRYMKGLYAWVGMPTVTLEYDRPARESGTTKWGFFRLVGLAIEGITSFSIAPLRIATVAGLITAMIGAAFGLWIVAKAFLFGDPAAGYPSLIALIALIGGMQLIGIGILGEYLGKTYLETKQRPIYLIRNDITLTKNN
jgi:polyisoprenyl-phosphate glycosyltransferase